MLMTDCTQCISRVFGWSGTYVKGLLIKTYVKTMIDVLKRTSMSNTTWLSFFRPIVIIFSKALSYGRHGISLSFIHLSINDKYIQCMSKLQRIGEYATCKLRKRWGSSITRFKHVKYVIRTSNLVCICLQQLLLYFYVKNWKLIG